MSIAKGMPHTETGITVNFPTRDYYQFESCPEYQKVSGDGVKEMDFIWYDTTDNTVWLVELKGFYFPENEKHVSTDLGDQEVLSKKLQELEAKALHSLVMLATKRTNLHQCAGAALKKQKIKLMFILEVIPQQESYLTFIRASIEDTLKPFLRLFAVESVMVVNQEIGKSIGLKWIGGADKMLAASPD